MRQLSARKSEQGGGVAQLRSYATTQMDDSNFSIIYGPVKKDRSTQRWLSQMGFLTLAQT
jgi:hypothetical protein